MNDMQLAMVKAGIVSPKAIQRMEAEKAAQEEERRQKDEAARKEAERIKAHNEQIAKRLKAQAEQVESSDDGKHRRDAHRRFVDGTPRRKSMVN